ncbi:MAG: diacylglycerol kinase [Firmicutes bacterium]|nr:diacylglycerol kinase [Bacillota bacterium]
MADFGRRGGLLVSFSRALAGVGLLLGEPNARIHAAAALTVTGAGLLLGLTLAEWAVVTLVVTLVIALEGLNTALEECADLAAPGRHEAARRAKDAAAGAVLVGALGAVGVAAFVFGPRLGELGPRFQAAWAERPVVVALWLAAIALFLFHGLLRRGERRRPVQDGRRKVPR